MCLNIWCYIFFYVYGFTESDGHNLCKSPTYASDGPTSTYIFTHPSLFSVSFSRIPPLPFRQDKRRRSTRIARSLVPPRPSPSSSVPDQTASGEYDSPPKNQFLALRLPRIFQLVGLYQFFTGFDLASDFLGFFPFLSPPFQEIGWRGRIASSIWKIRGGGKRRTPRPKQQVRSFLGQHFGGICGGFVSDFLVSFFLSVMWCFPFCLSSTARAYLKIV